MKKILTIIVGYFFLIILSAFSGDYPKNQEVSEEFDESECVAAFSKPILMPSPLDYSTPKIEWLSTRTVRETIEIDPDIIVEIQHGACSHFGITFRFTFQETPFTTFSDIDWIKKSGNLLLIIKLESLEYIKEKVYSEIQNLDSTFIPGQIIIITEGWDHLYLNVFEFNKNITIVEFSYGFAL